jgi:PAS domain S-box-containing protein
MLHPLIERQISRADVSEELKRSEAGSTLLHSVSQAYFDADRERYRLERAMTVASEEMAELTASLASERDRLHVIIQSMGTALGVVNMNGKVEDCNSALLRMLETSREDVIGRELRETFKGLDAPESGSLPAKELVERQIETKTGRGIWVTLFLSPLGDESGVAILTAQDVTERKQLEVSLRHAQRLESVGQLAAGIAHEINTPIQFIGDNLGFLRGAFQGIAKMRAVVLEHLSTLPESQELRAKLEALEEDHDLDFVFREVPKAIAQSLEGIEHVGRIVQAMRVFSHLDQTDQATSVDINASLRSTVTVARNETKYVADVELELDDVPVILGFAGDLNQVFLNLLVNAAHAVGDAVAATQSRGKITLRTRVDGPSVVVSIGDTGTGIPEAVRRRVFDPFFTTKEVGKGTGQGLALARSLVVEKHGGEIWFETETGRGTTFFVRLPIRGPAVATDDDDFVR